MSDSYELPSDPQPVPAATQALATGAGLTRLGQALQAAAAALREVSSALEHLGAELERQTTAAPGSDAREASAQQPSPAAVPGPSEAALAVTEFLATRYIEVLHIARERVEPDLWLQLAKHMASTYPLTRPLLDAIKKTQGNGRAIVLPLRDMPPEQITAITSLGALASRAQLLPGYHYRRGANRTVFCQPPVAPEAISFFVGGWLELWAHDTVASALGAPSSDWHVCSGIQIRLANGEHAELDILAVHTDGRAVWLEAKTGQAFAEHLPKYKRIGARLDVDAALLLACDLPTPPETVAAVAGMTPCTIHDTAPRVASIARRAAGLPHRMTSAAPEQTGAALSGASRTDNLADCA